MSATVVPAHPVSLKRSTAAASTSARVSWACRLRRDELYARLAGALTLAFVVVVVRGLIGLHPRTSSDSIQLSSSQYSFIPTEAGGDHDPGDPPDPAPPGGERHVARPDARGRALGRL